MQNYQKCYYKHFYTVSPDGVHTEVSRQECFAPDVDSSPDCPFKQRWFYDCEAGYAARLPRNAYGEELGKLNAADRKKQERKKANDIKHTGIALDRSIGYDEEGTEVLTELEDETADLNAIYEEKSNYGILMDFMRTLSLDDQKLWALMKDKVKKQDIADHFHLSLDGVRYRENRLKGIVRSNPQLRSYYTDD